MNYIEHFSEYQTIKGYNSETVNKSTVLTTYFINWITDQNIQLEEVSYNDVIAYVNYRKQLGNSQSTIQKYIIVLNHFFNFLISEHKYIENPCSNVLIKGVKRKVLYEILTPLELETIYKTYNTEPKTDIKKTFAERSRSMPPQENNNLARKRNKIILGLLIYQGLRTEEIGKLQLQDLQLREGKITIQGANRTEGRTLKLEPHQVYDLMDYVHVVRKEILQATKKESTLVFISVGASLNFKNMIQRFIETICLQSPKVKTAKHIRTSVITNWLKLYNLRKVQYMAGHRYISTTESYQVNNIDALKDDISKFHPLA